MISGLYALIGAAAVLFPFALRQAETGLATTGRPGGLLRWAGLLMTLGGLFLLGFGALNSYTHIGLIINTTPKQSRN